MRPRPMRRKGGARLKPGRLLDLAQAVRQHGADKPALAVGDAGQQRLARLDPTLPVVLPLVGPQLFCPQPWLTLGSLDFAS